MRRVFIIFIAITGFFIGKVQAQDPQFSQFYAAPLYINPAFSGASYYTRVGANYRNQWPSLNASFVTFSAYMDHYIDRFNSGLGLIVTTDREGLAGLKSTSIGLSYAYQLKISDNLVFRPGVQFAYVSRNVNFTDLVFGSQIDPINGFNPNASSGENLGAGANVNYTDIAVGGLFYSKNLFVGFSALHLTEPNQSLLEDGDSPLPMRMSFHAGYKIKLADGPYRRDLTYTKKERSITPVIQYKTQGAFDQMDVGAYLHLEPVNFGVQYRGLPFKQFEGFPNNEALIFTLGVTTSDFNIGYSYDYTLSELGIASGGAHEFSIAYFFELEKKKRVPRERWRIPCPKN